MKEIYIIDAVNYLFRSYYAIGPMTNPSGQSTSAVYGFIRSIQKLIKQFSPTHLVAVFDGPDNKKSRQTLFADYKMHRKGAPEDLFPQFEWASQFCKIAGIPTLCVEGVEADDTMATVALWAKKQGMHAYLCTSDKDLLQLVCDEILVIHPHKDNAVIDAKKVEELFNVRPNQMLDYLAIVGDASDNIPGIEGFGPKTAATLLAEFGSLDAILSHPEKVKGEKKQAVLREQKDRALLSRQLATLHTQVTIFEKESSYQLQKPDSENLKTFYREMGFNSLLKELGGEEVPSALKTEYVLVDSEEALKALLENLMKEKEVGLDTETTSVNPFLAELVGVGFCVKAGKAWYVPCNGSLGEKAVEQLRSFFLKTPCAFFGHNIKYDLHVLQRAGAPVTKICFDTMIASYLYQPQNRRHGLDELSLEIYKHIKIPIEQLIGKGKDEKSMREVPIDLVKTYCCEDIDYTARLKAFFSEKLKEQKLEKVFTDIELPLIPILAKMEQTGIFLDIHQLALIGKTQLEKLETIKARIFQEVGEEFNLNSPKQLSHILFEKLEIKKPTGAKSEFATDAESLETLAEENPVAGLILEYRTLEKLRSTYIEALPESIHPQTGKVHCTFNQSVAATGRLSCQNPNLQNIPVRDAEGLAIRSCFRPKEPQWVYIGADYSQIELRLLAHFSKDPELLRAFRKGEDIHASTASLIFDLPIEMITPAMRNQAKTVNFGILYGQGPFGLAKQLKIPIKEASEFIKTYFERYPKIQEYLERCKEEARTTGAVRTVTGRQRPIPEILNPNQSIRAAAERLATNTPLQGTAADLIKLAMISIDRQISQLGLEGKMILQIHDELIFEVPEREVSTFEKLIRQGMQHVLKLDIPLEVHIAIGKNWAEC